MLLLALVSVTSVSALAVRDGVVLGLGRPLQARATSNASSVPLVFSNLSSCPAPVLSCSGSGTNATSNAAISNTCCGPTPGGLVLATQFWDTYTGLEDQGQLLPQDSWTLHGLWPDFCNGSYTQYCDLSRQYDPAPSPNTTNGLANGTVVPPYTGPTIDGVLKNFSRYDLLDFMNAYWVNQGAPSTTFWAHEFSKHATCFSTFDVKCYSNYQPKQDVLDFFLAAVRAFQRFPTFEILAANGIVPSNTTTYTLAQLQGAFLRTLGAVPYLGCSNQTSLDEVWYYNYVKGTPQFGDFTLVNSTSPSSCSSSTPIHYYLRSAGSEISRFTS